MFEYAVWLRETDSTQKRLREGNYPCGMVFIADRQKEGKGRKGRRWESQEGGLYFSFVLCEEDFRDYLSLPLVIGLAVVRFLEDVGIRTAIKWPNDVYLRGKKAAGVLAEKIGRKIVVGIGLNVNQKDFPQELKDSATSLYLETGKIFDRREILSGLLSSIAEALDAYKREGFKAFKKEIEERLIFKGEEVIVLSEEPVVGIMLGIDDKGYLLLQTAEGVKSIAAGDVSLRLHR